MRKMSRKAFNYGLLKRTAKSPLFSTISFAAIFLIIYADSLISNLSLNPPDIIRPRETLEPPETPKIERQPESTFNSMPQLTTQEKTEEVDSATSDTIIPPLDITREERMAWFRRKLPEFQILKSSSLSEQFHGRVLEFFSNECTVRFFMVWLSTVQSFGPREFLAVDSLFKTNPHGCLMILSRSMDTIQGYRILKPVLDHGFKVLAVTPDLPFLVKDTPAEAWFEEMKKGRTDPGKIPLFNNLSNLIRLAMLYKYGGVYLDTDFIILRDFQGLRNAVGAQSIDQVTKKWTRLNGAVMVFDINHPLLLDFLEEFATTFNGNKWGHNGPYLVSRVIERVGNTPDYNLTILPPRAFYPVDWIKIARLFKNPGEEGVDLKYVIDTLLDLNRESYALHLWNKRSRHLVIEDGSIMERLIADHCVVCPHTYNS